MRRSGGILAIDLFAGCGGLTLGVKKAGVNVVLAIESDQLAASTYSANHPEVLLVQDDIRRVPVRPLLTAMGLRRGELDLLAGCPPCQGFSRMTNRNKPRSALDERNDLIFELIQWVRAFLPKNVLIENVPGFRRHWRFKRSLTLLRRLGYRCRYQVMDAADFSVPQRRLRLILVASRQGEPQLPTPRKEHISVREALKKNPLGPADPLHSFRSKHSRRIRELIRSIPKDGGSRTSLPAKMQLACHRKLDGFKDVYGRMSWDEVAPTITGACFNPSKGRFLHPERNRAISLREASLLQTFPRSYKFPSPYLHSREKVGLLIGNALPPEFARAQALRLFRRAGI